MTADYDRAVGIDRLKDHYKHCIRLSASNKINPKNAFDLQLIDYMQDLVSSTEDGQMNFKIASSALDVGAKIYSNRVDRIQSEAQKVASSILMALDGQHTGKHQVDDDDAGNDPNISGGSDRMNDTQDDEDGSGQNKEKDKRKVSRKKNVKTVVEDENSLNAKLEKIILGDPYLDGLARDFDMSCPAALICYNALTQPNCLLTIESNNLRKNYMEYEPKPPTTSPSPPPVPDLPTIVEETDNDGDVTMAEEEIPATSTTNSDLNSRSPSEFVSLLTRKVNCAQIIRNNQNNQICPRLETFLFNDRSTTLSGPNPNDDTTRPESSQGRVYITKTSTGGAHEFNPEHYGADQDFDNGDDHFGGDVDSVMGDNPNDVNENENPIPDLDKIAASKPTEYGYASEHHRLMNTWAGPHAWKVLKAPQNGKKDAPKSTKKRSKTEQMPIDFNEAYDPSLEKMADKDIRHSADVIKKWKKPLLPKDHNLTEDKVRKALVKAFLRPEDTYHCRKTPAEALLLVGNDHNYHRDQDQDSDGGFHSPAMGGFDDVHDDSDLEFRADPVVDGQEVAIYGAEINNTLAQQADLEFAGENLIEQPFEVAQVNIPFAKIAKKMDVRKLKRVMWDLLFPPEKRDTLNATIFENGMNSKDKEVDKSKSSDKAGDETAMCVDAGGDENETVTENGESVKKTTPSPAPSESAVHLEFSNLYGELPIRVSDKMANDLSQPIAFVTLLHLANEKNLKLIPNQDLKDFIIEQDEMDQ